MTTEKKETELSRAEKALKGAFDDVKKALEKKMHQAILELSKKRKHAMFTIVASEGAFFIRVDDPRKSIGAPPNYVDHKVLHLLGSFDNMYGHACVPDVKLVAVNGKVTRFKPKKYMLEVRKG